jgi:anti-anti-sigma factor
MIEVLQQEEVLVLQMPEKVDSNLAREINNELRKQVSKAQKINIDMRHTLYLDSSGLGLLLHLRELAGADKSQISLHNLTPHVANTIKVSGFGRLFEVV